MKKPDELPKSVSKKPRTEQSYVIPSKDVSSDDFRLGIGFVIVEACHRGKQGHKPVAVQVHDHRDGLEVQVVYESQADEFPNAGGRW
jgi:hypothetical protein